MPEYTDYWKERGFLQGYETSFLEGREEVMAEKEQDRIQTVLNLYNKLGLTAE